MKERGGKDRDIGNAIIGRIIYIEKHTSGSSRIITHTNTQQRSAIKSTIDAAQAISRTVDTSKVNTSEENGVDYDLPRGSVYYECFVEHLTIPRSKYNNKS